MGVDPTVSRNEIGSPTLNVKALVGAFNQEEALEGTLFIITEKAPTSAFS